MDVALKIVGLTIPKFEFTEYAKQNRDSSPNDYEFEFGQQLKIDEQEEILSSLFSVKLFEKINEHTKYELASMTLLNEVAIENFHRHIIKGGDQLKAPDPLVLWLANLTLQHVRGALAVKLEHTRYTNAILPLVDPQIFTSLYKK